MLNELPNELLVKAWMNPPEYTVKPSSSLEEAFETMQRHAIHHLLVVSEEDELVAVVTDRDLRRLEKVDGKLTSIESLYRLGEALSVADVMSPDPMYVSPDTTTADAARRMVENRIHCLPVVAQDGDRVVGIVTSSDLLAALVHDAEASYDEAI